MPITKNIESPTGATATHWVPTEATINLRTRIVDCTLRGWLDVAAFAAGKQPLDVRQFRFGPAQLDVVPGALDLEITALLEALITAAGEFGPELVEPVEPEPEPAPTEETPPADDITPT